MIFSRVGSILGDAKKIFYKKNIGKLINIIVAHILKQVLRDLHDM